MLMKLANQVPAMMLRSPLHGVFSSRYLVIEFTGRKSGRRFRTPVAYVAEGDRILMSTDSPWWRNFTAPAPVRLWLRGRRRGGTATAMSDPEDSAAALRQLVEAIPSYARPANLVRDQDGKVSEQEITRAVAAGRVGIVVELAAKD